MMWIVVFVYIFGPIHGFLLDNSNGTTQGKSVYLTTAEYYQDKQLLATHRELNLLASQIQIKLEAFEQKLLLQTLTGQSQSSSTEQEHKYQAMAQQLSTLEQKNKILEETLATKDQEITVLRQNLIQEKTKIQDLIQGMAQVQQQIAYIGNQTANLQQNDGHLDQMKSINDTVHNIKQETHSIADQVKVLESVSQARGQDFVALYNKVNSLEMEESELKKLEETTLIKLNNITEQQTTALQELENRIKTDFDVKWGLQNNSLLNLQQYVDSQLQPVILTASYGSERKVEQYTIVTFPNIVTSVGITDQTHFQQTGRFWCSSPGYYYVTTTIVSNEVYTTVAIIVNNDTKHSQYVTGYTYGYHGLGSAGVTVHLTAGDEVWIRHESSWRQFYRSWFTIFKLK